MHGNHPCPERLAPVQISAMYADVMAAHHTAVALDTHSRFLAAAAGFGGDKSGNLQAFYARLTDANGTKEKPSGKPIGLSEIVRMGMKVRADLATEGDEARLEREAEQAAMKAMFDKHKSGKSVPK